MTFKTRQWLQLGISGIELTKKASTKKRFSHLGVEEPDGNANLSKSAPDIASPIERNPTPNLTPPCPSPADLAVVEMTDAFRQPSLFYHLGVRESFSMANNIILYCDTNSDSLQSLQVSRREGPGQPCPRDLGTWTRLPRGNREGGG